jgi:hypothetical protein
MTKAMGTATATATATKRMVKLVSVLALMLSGVSAEKTVMLFIIAGDANVEGRASIPELHDLAIPPGTIPHDNSTPANAYEHLVDDKGKWVTRDDVYVVYEQDRFEGLKSGPLSVKGFGHNPNTFGPDVEFGHVMGNTLTEKVVIVKAGWERRTLAKDFRPPSAEGTITGFQFLRIVSTVRQTIQNLGDILGDDYAHAEVEISGLVWWHGYDDIKSGTSDEYFVNLQCLIRDFRQALELPYLPVLIAELGGGGQDASQEELDFRAMQQRVVNLPEFNETTRIVETAKFSDEGVQATTTDDYTHYYGRAHTTISVARLMAVYMTELARFDLLDKDSEQIEADFEHFEDNLRITVMLLFGIAVAGFVVFAAVMRGGITKRNLTKAWKDTVVAFRDSEKDMIDGDDDFSGEGPSTEMAEGRAEEILMV